MKLFVKYRAWDLRRKCMFRVGAMFWGIWGITVTEVDHEHEYKAWVEEKYYQLLSQMSPGVDVVLMEATGFRDRVRIEIYERDYVQLEGSNRKYKIQKDAESWTMWLGAFSLTLSDELAKACIVIGNVFEKEFENDTN